MKKTAFLLKYVKLRFADFPLLFSFRLKVKQYTRGMKT